MKDKLYLIGRNEDKVDILIEDISVSSSHAQLLFSKGKLTLIDLESKNGVFVNYKQIAAPTILNKGAIIRFGNVICEYADLLNAVKEHQYNDSLQFKYVTLKGKSSNISKPFYQKKWFYISLTILSIALSVFLTYIFTKQQSIKQNFEKTKTEHIDDAKVLSDDDSFQEPLVDNNNRKQRTDITYDLSCMEDEQGSVGIINILSSTKNIIEDEVLKGITVTVADEEEFGKMILDDISENHSVITKGARYRNLKSILNNLEKRISNPRGFNYEIFLIEDTIVNAYTAGGKIFFYEGMYNLCNDNSELAAIIGHEIAHNELGHVTNNIKKLILANELGGVGEISLVFNGLFDMATMSFNQKQEVECDLFGMDLMYPTHYKNCASISLWERMHDKNQEADFHIVDNLFRSHPYSKSRSICIKHHLQTNYSMSCEK